MTLVESRIHKIFSSFEHLQCLGISLHQSTCMVGFCRHCSLISQCHFIPCTHLSLCKSFVLFHVRQLLLLLLFWSVDAGCVHARSRKRENSSGNQRVVGGFESTFEHRVAGRSAYHGNCDTSMLYTYHGRVLHQATHAHHSTDALRFTTRLFAS